MHRFYVDKTAIADGQARIAGEDLQHLSRVLRLTAGDRIRVCDGESGEYEAVLTRVDKAEAVAELGDRREMDSEPRCRVTLYQALPKAGKLELIVQKGTELGVSAFVPFASEFCVAKPDGEEKKRDRLRRVAYEAAKQSGRGVIPDVSHPLTFGRLCETLKSHELALLAWEQERAASLKGALSERPQARDVAIVIGPEGGISAAEAQRLAQSGAVPVTLGRRILRTETAGMAMAAMILYHYGDME